MHYQQNSTHSTADLTRTQVQVITALASGATVTDATRQANVDRSTFYLWLKSDGGFQTALNRVKQEYMDSMRERVSGLADTAISVLEEMLCDKDIPPAVRLRAALAVLQGGEALDTVSSRFLIRTDATIHVEEESAVEIFKNRLAQLAERQSAQGLSCNGSVT